MKVLSFDKKIFDYYIDHHLETLKASGIELVYQHPKNIELDEGVTVVIGTVREGNLAMLPSLKTVMVTYTGLNGLPMDLFADKGIEVINTSAHGIFVAERGLSLLLALLGQVVSNHVNLTKGDWSNRFKPEGIPWKTLHGRKVAIYGYGTIGKEVARLMAPWAVRIGVLAYKDRDFGDVKVFGTLADMAKWCDVLVIAAPLTPETQGSVDEQVIGAMKGKYMVNVGRGVIVDEALLYESLKKGHLAGYASDVWYQYPGKEEGICFPSNYPIHELENVVMTPHNATFEETSAKVRYEDLLGKLLGVDTNPDSSLYSE